MARKSVARSFIQWMHRHYDEYLDGAQTDGTHRDEWKTVVCRDALASPTASGLDKATMQLVNQAADQLWHSDPRAKGYELFSVAGVDIRHTYTFADASVPGGYRRVSGRWASVRHAAMDAQIARAKADEALLAAAQKLRDYRRIATRAGEDPDCLLWELRDEPPAPAAHPPEGPRPSP